MHDEVIAEFRPRAEAALSFVDKTVKDRPSSSATPARSRISAAGVA
jgi:hypothetical protein